MARSSTLSAAELADRTLLERERMETSSREPWVEVDGDRSADVEMLACPDCELKLTESGLDELVSKEEWPSTKRFIPRDSRAV